MVTSWNSVFIPKKLSGKEEEAKMFRLLFALSFVFILSTFAVSKNQFVSGNFFVIKYQDISSLCGWINVLKYSCWTLHSLESYHVVRARSPFFFSGFEEWNTAKSVRKVRFEGQLFLPRRYERITTCWVWYFAQMEFAISWYFMFSFTLTILFHLCFFRQRRQRWPKRYGITNKSLG